MVEYLAGSLVLAAAVLFVGSPLLGRGVGAAGEEEGVTSRDPGLERERVYAALTDLEYEFRTGKVEEEDYHKNRKALIEQAVWLLAEEQSRRRVLEQELEAEIAEAVRALAADPEARRLQSGACPACGTARLEQDQSFCHRCGTPLAREVDG